MLRVKVCVSVFFGVLVGCSSPSSSSSSDGGGNSPPIDASLGDSATIDAPMFHDCPGEECEDPTVANTTPFGGSVYLHGAVGIGACADELQRFWPNVSTTALEGFSCDSKGIRYRRRDNVVFDWHFGIDHYLSLSPVDYFVEQTPPCAGGLGEPNQVDPQFDFDGSSSLYYVCNHVLRKENGVMVAPSVGQLVAVLDDGRIIVTQSGAGGSTDYVVLGSAGNGLSRLSPAATFTGSLTPVPDAATVTLAGDRAYVLYLRTYGAQQTEIVVFRVDQHSQWARVRRVAVPAFGNSQIALSDGTVFLSEPDPDGAAQTKRIVGFFPDGTNRIVWRESDAGSIGSTPDLPLLLGPQ